MWHDLKGGATSTRQMSIRQISARQFLVLFKNTSYLHLSQGLGDGEHRSEQCQAFGNRTSRT